MCRLSVNLASGLTMRNVRSLCFTFLASLLFAFVLFSPYPTWAACTSGVVTGCSATGLTPNPSNCQWRTACDGDVYGSVTAPTPAQSMGSRIDAGRTNILYYNPGDPNYTNLSRFVDNNSPSTAPSMFVPQGSPGDFGSFAEYAPSSITLGFCTIGVAKSYTGTAHLPDGFWITTAVNPTAQLPTPATYKTATTSFTLPTTRSNSSFVSQNSVITMPYTRWDCAPGMTPTNSSCNKRAIIETQWIKFTATPNGDPRCADPQGRVTDTTVNCNGSWDGGAVSTYSCSVDGVTTGTGMPSCLAGYNAPVSNAVAGQCGTNQYTCDAGTLDQNSESDL